MIDYRTRYKTQTLNALARTYCVVEELTSVL